MPKDDLSGSEGRESDSNSSQEEEETESTPRGNGGGGKMTEYEKERMKRIEENRAKMQAMGLNKMAYSLMGSVQKKRKSDIKGKRKVGEEEDEEYSPPQEEEGLGSSSEGDDEDDSESYGSRRKKRSGKSLTPSRKVPNQKLLNNSDFVVDDDDALMQAIALSLQGSAGFLDVVNNVPSQSSDANLATGKDTQRKRNIHQEDAGRRKRKNLFTSRLQMTEDELILHFFQFDEAGKGGITLRDLRRVAVAHDFMWTDQQMEDMVYYFDSDGDGKLSLDDFSKIVERCNMRKGSESAATGSEA